MILASLGQKIKGWLRSFLGIDADFKYLNYRQDYIEGVVYSTKKELFKRLGELEKTAKTGFDAELLKLISEAMTEKVEKIAEKERNETVFINNELRDYFLARVEEYIKGHHHGN